MGAGLAPFSAAGRDVGPASLGFLGLWLFGFESSAFACWISLDFLGFSRPNRTFSMSYAG
jgi:hypothetical protein